MAKEPADRFTTAMDMSTALSDVRGPRRGGTIDRSGTGIVARLRRESDGRYRRVAGAMTAGVASMALAIGSGAVAVAAAIIVDRRRLVVEGRHDAASAAASPPCRERACRVGTGSCSAPPTAPRRQTVGAASPATPSPPDERRACAVGEGALTHQDLQTTALDARRRAVDAGRQPSRSIAATRTVPLPAC